jgi:Holliday junction DNA helicase RuvA
MFEYIRGKLVSRHPTHAVVETGGIGYLLHITLHSYDRLREGEEVTLLTWLQVQEDAHRLWGFLDGQERDVFLHLVSVSGIGPNTARLILSGMTADDCRQAIVTDNELAFRQVKGVGPKTAKRVIMELKDKILKSSPGLVISGGAAGPRIEAVEEALSALVTLGFVRSQAEKALQQVLRELGSDATTETLVRTALRLLSA